MTRGPWRGRLLPGGNLPCTPVPVFDQPAPAELRRVAADQEHPRLSVHRDLFVNLITDERRWWWWWELTGPNAERLDDGRHATWAEALAVGLAALEVASAGTQ